MKTLWSGMFVISDVPDYVIQPFSRQIYNQIVLFITVATSNTTMQVEQSRSTSFPRNMGELTFDLPWSDSTRLTIKKVVFFYRTREPIGCFRITQVNIVGIQSCKVKCNLNFQCQTTSDIRCARTLDRVIEYCISNPVGTEETVHLSLRKKLGWRGITKETSNVVHG